MANQKISDLERLVQPEDLSAADLFVVVDTDSHETPSGSTKQMTAETLAQALTNLSAGLIGADFINLRDTPEEYTIDNHGNYLKVKVEVTPQGNLESGLEFVDSPGASEQTFSYIGNFETDVTLFVGGLVRRTANGKFGLASSADEALAECVGIIKKIKSNAEGDPISVSIVFGGYVEFTSTSEQGIDIIDSVSATESTTTNSLANGVVHFLGTNGKLATFDPAEKGLNGDAHVSKPVLIGTGGLTGIFVNYRGLYHPEDEEANKFTIERDDSCSALRTGDLVRVKGSRDASNTNISEFVPSSAEDFETSHVIGIVTLATADYFEIQTNGLVTFPSPEGILEKGISDILLKPGTQYYLDTLKEIPIADRFNMYDIATFAKETQGDADSTATISDIDYTPGVPFRNSLPEDPASPLIPTDTGYEVYSRPVFYAITENRLLLTNHRTLPNPGLECNDCLEHAEMDKSIYWPDYTTSAAPNFTTSAALFLDKVWPTAGVGHWAILYKDSSVGQTARFRKYESGWVYKLTEEGVSE